jgi:hypothetical protein
MTFAERMKLKAAMEPAGEREVLKDSLLLQTHAERVALNLRSTLSLSEAENGVAFKALEAMLVFIARQMGIKLPVLLESIERRYKGRHADGLMIR